MSNNNSEQYWDRFWEDYPEQVSKDLEDRKIEYRFDCSLYMIYNHSHIRRIHGISYRS